MSKLVAALRAIAARADTYDAADVYVTPEESEELKRAADILERLYAVATSPTPPASPE